MIIVSANQGGIANRIFCLINSIYIMEQEKNRYETLMLYWGEDKRFSYSFNDLFSKQIKLISKEELRKVLRNKHYQIYTNEKLICPKETTLRILKELKFKYELNVSYDIGFHIRRGDFVDIGVAKVSPLGQFVVLHSIYHNLGYKTYVASDDRNTAKSILGASSYFDNPKYDLECLSRCRKIYHSYDSSFSELAYYLGGGIAERIAVVDIEALKKWKEELKQNKKSIRENIYNLLPIEWRFFRK